MVWALFGLQWVMPHGVFDLFSSWQGSFGGHRSIDLWRAVPHCVLWCIWRERNSRCFEGKDRSISEIKSLLLHTLLEWSSSFNLFPCSNLLEMLDLCNFCVWCTVFHVHPRCTWLLINTIPLFIKKKSNSWNMLRTSVNQIWHCMHHVFTSQTGLTGLTGLNRNQCLGRSGPNKKNGQFLKDFDHWKKMQALKLNELSYSFN